jgi:tetratricopeptide (TPR) repeat protein
MNESVLENALRLRRAGKFAEAAQLYSDILKRDPKHFEALRAAGILHYQLGRLEEAVHCFGRALALKPDYFEALDNRGSALLRPGRTAEAVADAERLVAMRPNLPQAWASRGSALFDTARITRNLEFAYATMWERQQRGPPPATFTLEGAALS